MNRLPDGSGFFVGSFPLSKDHWIYEQNDYNHKGKFDREQFSQEQMKALIDAAKIAIRGATMSGKEMDFDPDALIQNLIVAMFGSWEL